MFYISEFQINLQIPFETPIDIEVEVIVKRDGLSSEPFTLIVREDAISIFIYDVPAGSAVFELAPSCCTPMESRLVTPENPAKPNEVLVIYATGFGPLLNGPPTGMPAPFPPDDSLTITKPAVIYSTNLAGSILTVQYSGLAAGYVGLWQLNIKMPSSIPLGENPAMRITLENSFQSIAIPFEE